MRSWTTRVGVCLFVLFLVPVVVAAQTQTGGVTGSVIDATNAAVPGADVTLKSNDTGSERKVITNDQGVFYFDQVWPGIYTLTIAKDGFRTHQATNMDIRVGRISNLGSIMLELGAVGEVVEVDAESVPLLETQSAQITGSFSAKQVTSLRQGFGGLDSIAILTPGVAPGFGNINSNGMQISANGQRSRSTQFMLDGHQMNDITIGGPSFFVSNLDSVAEYQVVTNQFDASMGRNLGATVNIVTKGGTNDHHGSVFWLYEGSALRSKTKNESRLEQDKPVTVDNTGGLNVGGPVVRDRLFYYFAYTRQKIPGGSQPSGSGGTLALTPNGINTLLAAYPNSEPLQVYRDNGPFARTDGNPQCVGITRMATLAGVEGVEACDLTRTVPGNVLAWEYNARADYQQGRHTLFGRYLVQSSDFCCIGGVTGYWIGVPFRADMIGATHTFQITPNQVNYFRFAFGRFQVSFEGANTFPISEVRKNLANISFGRMTVPTGEVDEDDNPVFETFGAYGLGLATNLPQNRFLDTYQFQNNWSLIRGRHTFKAGIEFQRNLTTLFFLPFINGAFSYSVEGWQDVADNTPGQVRFAAGNGSFDPTETDQFYYFQDDIRISPNFTLNLGVRYEHNGQPINRAVDEVLARESDPTTAFWPTTLPLEDRTIRRQPNDNNNVAPRIGFAWTPRFGGWFLGDGKTTWRGGYGVSYELAFYNILLNMTTAAPRVFLFALTGASATPLPAGGTGEDVANAIPVPRGTIDPRFLAQTQLSEDFHNPYGQNWSLGFQREIGRGNQVVEMRYVGSNSVGQFQSINANPLFTSLAADFPQFVPSGVTPCTVAGSPGVGRPDCNRAALRERRNSAHSIYHSLQMRYDARNLFNQLTGGFAYTLAKGIDNVSEIFFFTGNGSPSFSSNPFNFSSNERGESNFSRRHVFSAHYIWEVPMFRSQRGVLGRILGGWEISGITSAFSGQPWTPSMIFPGNPWCGEDFAFNLTFIGTFVSCRPIPANLNAPFFIGTPGASTGNVPNIGFVDSTGVIRRGSSSGPVVSFSDVAFLFNNANAVNFFSPSNPFGIGRNNFRGHHSHNWDIAVSKVVRVTERVGVRYRMAMSNAFNRRSFGVPNIFIDSGTSFGDFQRNNASGRQIRMYLAVYY